MPKAPVLNQQFTFETLLKHLSQSGPQKAKDLCQFLGLSQPAFSRLIGQRQDAIIRIGQGRQTLYACHRLGAWGKPEIPIIIIDESGTQSLVATLHPLSPRGFYLESQNEIFSNRIYESLPYFFEDLRPSGFLGRLVPKLHPDLDVPQDILLWTDDHCLLYLSRYGWDLIGNLIIGEKSTELYLKNRIERLDVVAEANREKHYPHIAELVLSQGIPGSSAAGEQPKFLSIREIQEGLIPVIVKFSPPVSDGLSRRIADLLICEHITHETLRKHGRTAPRSCLINGNDGRIFLEMERFDRNMNSGRLGIISLQALALGVGCLHNSWSETAESLLKENKIDQVTYQEIVWLEVFGNLIGNTDKHAGNISFFSKGENVLGLAPTYDMLPMLYAPQQNQLVSRDFKPDPPKFFEISVWNSALTAACNFWRQVQEHPQTSEEFKRITIENEQKLSSYLIPA